MFGESESIQLYLPFQNKLFGKIPSSRSYCKSVVYVQYSQNIYFFNILSAYVTINYCNLFLHSKINITNFNWKELKFNTLLTVYKLGCWKCYHQEVIFLTKIKVILLSVSETAADPTDMIAHKHVIVQQPSSNSLSTHPSTNIT